MEKNAKISVWARTADHIFFFRPLLILPIWAPLLIGYWASSGGSGLDTTFPLLLLLGIFLGGAIYGLNQIYDVEGDKLNKKNLPLALGFIRLKTAWGLTIASAVIALTLGIYLGIITGILTLLGLFMGALYSYPKFRWKDKPWHALIINGIGHGSLIYLIGWSSVNLLRWDSPLKMLPYAFAYGGVYLATTIPDIEGDKVVGKTTLGVLWGEKKTMLLAFALIVFSAIGGLFLGETALFLTALFASPFYFRAAKRGGHYWVKANKIAVLLLNIWVCFYVFPYLIVLAATILLSRLYYSKRLEVAYP